MDAPCSTSRPQLQLSSLSNRTVRHRR